MNHALNPITEFLRSQRVMVLDGGLATELEARGHILDDALWSARVLVDAPDAIRRLHYDYLVAGADCVTAATYQASIDGFVAKGMSDDEAAGLLGLGVDLAIGARDEFWKEEANRGGRHKPLVAASVGPYGAYLADGSEYDGRYTIDDAELYAFHRHRWQVLAASNADILACETIPSARESAVLLRLIRESGGRWAWLSFSCRDGEALNDGTPLARVVESCDRTPYVAAVGINCTSPRYIDDLIRSARRHTTKPILVYPNSGERYDATSRSWTSGRVCDDLCESALEWVRLGAAGVGGCCRVGPDEITALRERLVP